MVECTGKQIKVPTGQLLLLLPINPSTGVYNCINTVLFNAAIYPDPNVKLSNVKLNNVKLNNVKLNNVKLNNVKLSNVKLNNVQRL